MNINSWTHLTHTKHIIGATLEFNISLQHKTFSSVENTHRVVKQFFWRKSKAQRVFDFASEHNPYNN